MSIDGHELRYLANRIRRIRKSRGGRSLRADEALAMITVLCEQVAELITNEDNEDVENDRDVAEPRRRRA